MRPKATTVHAAKLILALTFAALFVIESVCAENDDSISAKEYYERGKTAMSKKEYEKAIDNFSNAIRIDTQFSQAFVARGNALLEKKEMDAAKRDYDEAIRVDSKNEYALSCRGYFLASSKEYQKAIIDYDECIRLNSKNE